MASTAASLSITAAASSSSLTESAVNSKSSPQCVSLPSLPPLLPNSHNRLSKTTAYCRKLARNVVAMATTSTGEAPVAATAEVVETTETPEILKTIQDAWDKVDDKYAVSSLAVAGGIALVGSAGMISAIDKLPLVPGVLELVGIGYTGWFAYRNLVNKPDRDCLIEKIKSTYKNIIGAS